MTTVTGLKYNEILDAQAAKGEVYFVKLPAISMLDGLQNIASLTGLHAPDLFSKVNAH